MADKSNLCRPFGHRISHSEDWRARTLVPPPDHKYAVRHRRRCNPGLSKLPNDPTRTSVRSNRLASVALRCQSSRSRRGIMGWIATHSLFTLSAGGLVFKLDFFSPISPWNYLRQSLPFSMCFIRGLLRVGSRLTCCDRLFNHFCDRGFVE